MKSNILSVLLVSSILAQPVATISSTVEMLSNDENTAETTTPIIESSSELETNNISVPEQTPTSETVSSDGELEDEEPTVDSSSEPTKEVETSSSEQVDNSSSTGESSSQGDNSSSEEQTKPSDSSSSEQGSSEKEETDKPENDKETEKELTKEQKDTYHKKLNELNDLPKELQSEYSSKIDNAKDLKELDAILEEAKATELNTVREQSLEELYGLDSLSHSQFSEYFNQINNAKSKQEVINILEGAKVKNQEEKTLKENLDKLLNNQGETSKSGGEQIVIGGSYGTEGYDLGGSSFTRNLKTDEFIKTIALQAHEDGQENDLFASITIAQAILESGSGNSSLAQPPNNNLFGIKGTHNGKSISLPTLEDDGKGNMYTIYSKFRVYPSYKESIADHSELLVMGIDGNPNIYKGAWKSEAKTVDNAAKHLQGRYATDTGYAKKLTGLIKTYDLERFDKKELTKEDKEYINSFDINSIKNENKPSSQMVGDYVQTFPTEFKKFLPSTYKPSTGGSQSGNRYPVGECTWYAYNRVFENGKYIQWFSGNSGNGGFWSSSAKQTGYEVNKKPEAGKLVVFEPGVMGSHNLYGHVAYVEAVNDKGDVLISEGGATLPLTGIYRVLPKAEAEKLEYVTPK